MASPRIDLQLPVAHATTYVQPSVANGSYPKQEVTVSDLPAARRHWNPAWTLVAASLALMMAFLDALVVTTALPTLRASLHSSLANLEWTVNAYNLALACLLLTGAAFGDRFGRRRMFCVGVSVFIAASLLAGAASTVDVLIAARALQGVGAAVMVPLTLTLVLEAYPPERHGWAIGIWSGVAALCGALGPVVGGGVVQAIGWHWIFWINLPVGMAILPIALLRFRESFGGHPRLDVVGLLLATAGLFSITWAIVRTDTNAWGSAAVIVPLLVGAAIIAAFLLWEHRTPQPMLSLSLFRRTSFSAANAISFCLFASVFGSLFLMSQFFQTAQGRTPLQTGSALLLWSGWGFFIAPATARFAGRYGNRPFMLAGLFLWTAGLACLAVIAQRDTGFLEIAPLFALAGIGGPMVFTTVAAEVMGSVPPEQIGIASGTNNALRELGGVFGIAVLATIFNRPGVYDSPDAFVSGFRSALWVAVAFTAIAIPLTGFLKARTREAPNAEAEPTPTMSEYETAPVRGTP
jgi:EmrB/QacA subfamily drug resistance transporter